MTKILEVRIGGAERDQLVVRVSGRERSPSQDSDDRNWLRGAVEVHAGRFTGATECSLRLEDFADFREELARLTDDRSATAKFKTMEDRLRISIKGGARGELTVTGHICDDPDGNRLAFRLKADDGVMTQVLSDLDQVIDEYSVR